VIIMEDLSIYQPKDKHDFDTVNNLYKLDSYIIITLIPSLLEWLQDINWPIAREISIFLLKYPEETIPHVKEVLKGNDNIWKEWCIRYFIKELPLQYIFEFKNELTRIAYNPTKGEELEEVNETANEILELINKV
jgi:hypothetical protein